MLSFSDTFGFFSIASLSGTCEKAYCIVVIIKMIQTVLTSDGVSSLTGAGVGVGVEFGVDSLDAGPSERFSSVPFNLSRLRASYWRSTILLKVSSSTAGLQC